MSRVLLTSDSESSRFVGATSLLEPGREMPAVTPPFLGLLGLSSTKCQPRSLGKNLGKARKA